MNLCCPTCGFKASIEVFAGDKAARHVMVLMGRVPPPLSELVLRYLGLFAPAKHAITIPRMKRLLEELVPMIEAGRINRARREWPVSLAQFEDGLQAMCDKRASLPLPLKSHGYLLEVLAGAVDKIEAQAEAKSIEHDRSGESRKAAEAVQGSEAAQWDEGRRLQAERLNACSALISEISGLKRLRLAVTDAALTAALTTQGYSKPAISFALSKRPAELPSANTAAQDQEKTA